MMHASLRQRCSWDFVYLVVCASARVIDSLASTNFLQLFFFPHLDVDQFDDIFIIVLWREINIRR